MRFLAFALVATLGACSTYRSGYEYSPRPHETQLRTHAAVLPQTGEADVLQARVLVSVIGLLRASEATGNQDRLHVRILVENASHEPMTFSTDQCVLTTANLRVCPLLSTEPASNPEIAPQQSQELNLMFALPSDFEDTDMSGLNLKWAVKILGREVTRSSAFERVEIRANPYYYDDHLRFHYGFGWCW